MKEDINDIIQGFAAAEKRSQHESALISQYEEIQRRGVVPHMPMPENPMKPEPEYPAASSGVHYKRILIVIGTCFAVYAVWQLVTAHAFIVASVVIGGVLISGATSGNASPKANKGSTGGSGYGGGAGNAGSGQTINITINAPNGGNVNF